jgi:hypothetical protein
MRRRDTVFARENLFSALSFHNGVVHGHYPSFLAYVVSQSGRETKSTRVEQTNAADAPPVTTSHKIDDLLV